ncbi:MAG: GIY-YIG nuclease family protein [Candidatus Hodarchaeales archaeon]
MFNRISTPLKDFSLIPTSPGIYRFIDEHQEILYIGASKNLQNRVSQYFRRSKLKEKKHSQIQILTRYIEYQEFENQESAFEAERLQIWTNRPRLNIRSNGIHSFSYLILRKEPHYHLLCCSNDVLDRLKEHDRIFRINLHSKKLEELIDQIRKKLKLCTTAKDNSCWEYQLNLCSRNCIQTNGSKPILGTHKLTKFINALTSADSTLLNEWSNQINIHIEKMQFEAAQRLNISLQALKVLQRRYAGIGYPFDQNKFTFKMTPNILNQIHTTITAYRDGKLVSKKSQNLFKADNLSLEVFILYFLQEYYQTHTIVPKKVSINYQLDSKNQFRFRKWMRRYFHQPVLLEISEL